MIRDATSSDQPGVQSVFERASLSNPGDRAILEAHPLALVHAATDDPTARCRVAVDDRTGTVVGFVTTTRAGDALELVDLFVDPSWMRRGIARSLIDDVEHHAQAAGVERIGVDGNPHAVAFYEAVGFSIEATVHTEFGPGLRMGRSL